MMKTTVCLGAVLLAVMGGFSCSKDSTVSSAPGAVSHHEHHAPHGGTPVALGREAYHLELVLDPASGKLTAYVLDGEMENFIRVNAASFEILASIGAEKEKHPVVFRAVSNSATGETVGDTSQFEAQADWLKTTPTFDAVLTSLNIKGTTFVSVAFRFPRGNERD